MKKYYRPSILIERMCLTSCIAMSTVEVGKGEEVGKDEPCSKNTGIWENMDED